MSQDWSNSKVAKQWDAEGSNTNPIRSEQLDILVRILANAYEPNKWFLDLGYGSGQVEQLIYQRIPTARIVGVDKSDAMMELAAERLVEPRTQFVSIKHDLANLSQLELPSYNYGCVFAIQSLHHLTPEAMQAAYIRVFDILQPGGLFLLMDRVRVETTGLWDVFRELWQRQDDIYNSSVAAHEGQSFQDHERIVRDRGDFPVLVDEHLSWLRGTGFETACLHVHGNRALIVGRKPSSKH